jgi:hypothetical protein
MAKKQATKKAQVERYPLTADEASLVQGLARRLWEEIGYDVLSANDGKSVGRAEVIELVLDAGRLDELVHRQPEWKTSANLRKLFQPNGDSCSDGRTERLEALMKETFRFARYGL